MTDRHCGYIVVLEKDMRDDDAESTIEALKHIKGVLSVEPVVTDLIANSIVESRLREEWGSKLLDVVYPDRKKYD